MSSPAAARPRPVRSPNPATWTRPELSSRRADPGGLGWLLWAALAALLLLLLLMGLLVAAAERQGRDADGSAAGAAAGGAAAGGAEAGGSSGAAAGSSGGDLASKALVGGAGVAAHPLGAQAAQQEPAGTGAGSVAGTVLFAESSAALDGQAQSVIRQAAAGIRAGGLKQVTVTGHTDVVAGNTVNDPLSGQRAQAVAQALRNQLPGVNVTVKAEGQAHPVADNRTDAGRQQNRRAVIQAH